MKDVTLVVSRIGDHVDPFLRYIESTYPWARFAVFLRTWEINLYDISEEELDYLVLTYNINYRDLSI